MPRKLMTACVSLLALGAASAAQAQTGTIYAYLSAPNTQYAPTSVPNTTSEPFTTFTTDTNFSQSPTGTNHSGTFSSAIGSYNGTFHVNADDTYGNGTGNYFTIGAQSGTSSPVTLTFTTPVTYFGLSYEAGDSMNGFTFYDASGNNLGRYSTATLTTTLNKGVGTVKTLDGNTYNTSQYYGKPNGGGPTDTSTRSTDGNEPFSFVNFFASSGTTISKIVFDNSGSTGSGFESDNHTISTNSSIRPPTTGDYVPIGTAIATAPDAGSLALATSALPLFGLIARRRKKP